MQSTIRITNRRAAQNSLVGYLCTLVLLVLAIGLLALRTPSAPLSGNSLIAPISAPQYQIDGQQNTYSGPFGG